MFERVLALPIVACIAACDPAPREDLGQSYVSMHGTEDCSKDCSGHEAGYRWARRKGIKEPDECGGRSRSFIEGCQAYARDF
jgi:hypothetical protein